MIIHTRTQIKVQYFKQFCDSIQKVYADDCVEILDYFEITKSVVFGEMHPQSPIVFIGHLENVSSAATRASSNK